MEESLKLFTIVGEMRQEINIVLEQNQRDEDIMVVTSSHGTAQNSVIWLCHSILTSEVNFVNFFFPLMHVLSFLLQLPSLLKHLVQFYFLSRISQEIFSKHGPCGNRLLVCFLKVEYDWYLLGTFTSIICNVNRSLGDEKWRQ